MTSNRNLKWWLEMPRGVTVFSNLDFFPPLDFLPLLSSIAETNIVYSTHCQRPPQFKHMCEKPQFLYTRYFSSADPFDVSCSCSGTVRILSMLLIITCHPLFKCPFSRLKSPVFNIHFLNRAHCVHFCPSCSFLNF